MLITSCQIKPVGGTVRILVWSVDPETEREDLAVPQSDCGTGIGQVLAMLYVATNSAVPRTIIIDEPQSFLHPEAIRKLFGIFKRYPRHQFIISTHSPVAVTEANPKTLILLRREGGETKSEVLNINEAGELRSFLSEIGARLSALETQLKAARQTRVNADVVSNDTALNVVNAVRGAPGFGENSALYRAMGYIPKNERKSGLVRPSSIPPVTLKAA